jgi:hypothetical protein
MNHYVLVAIPQGPNGPFNGDEAEAFASEKLGTFGVWSVEDVVEERNGRPYITKCGHLS